jgi:hypothetical protein
MFTAFRAAGFFPTGPGSPQHHAWQRQRPTRLQHCQVFFLLYHVHVHRDVVRKLTGQLYTEQLQKALTTFELGVTFTKI